VNLDDLRARIGAIDLRASLARSGDPIEMGGELGTIAGGWPRPGVSEVSGRVGAGRLRLLLPAVRALTHTSWVAVVDPLHLLHPPGLAGVRLERLIHVRPGPEQAGWATEQILRAGAVPLVVLLDPPAVGRLGFKLAHAAEQGRSSLVVLTERGNSRLGVDLRLQVGGQSEGRVRLRVVKRRGAPGGDWRWVHTPDPVPSGP